MYYILYDASFITNYQNRILKPTGLVVAISPRSLDSFSTINARVYDVAYSVENQIALIYLSFLTCCSSNDAHLLRYRFAVKRLATANIISLKVRLPSPVSQEALIIKKTAVERKQAGGSSLIVCA